MDVNTTAPFTFGFGHNGTVQQIVVNWPTDAQWIARGRAARSVMKSLAGGKTMSLPPSEDSQDKADLALFRAILVEPADAETVDDEYAMRVIEILDRGQITDVTQVGDGYEISLKVLGTQGIPPVLTKHTLRVPTFREERRWRNRSSALVSYQGNKFEVRSDPAFAAELYDALQVSAEGYTPGSRIPINHKVPIIGRLMATVLAADETEVEDEDRF